MYTPVQTSRPTERALNQKFGKIASAVDNSEDDNIVAVNPEHDSVRPNEFITIGFDAFGMQFRDDTTPKWKRLEGLDRPHDTLVQILRCSHTRVLNKIVDQGEKVGERDVRPDDPVPLGHSCRLCAAIRSRIALSTALVSCTRSAS